MAYRSRCIANMTVREIDDIFRRGRGIGRGLDAGAAPAEDEDFISDPIAHHSHQPAIQAPTAEVVDDELESVQ